MTKILLVEDDKSLREIYGVRLLAEGYDIVSAGDGEEALAMAIKERPQLIVSDVMMPKISGFDMLDILRSTTETRDIKVIMMTALSSEDQRARGEALGADRYLVKSQVGIEDVVRTVHDVLGDVPGAAPTPQQTFGTPAPTAVRPPAPVAARPMPTPEPQAQLAPVVALQPAPIPQPIVQAPQFQPQPQQSAAQAQPYPPVAPPQPTYAAPQQLAQNPIQQQPAATPSPLPQPTAPFSSPRPASLGDRIIHPLETPTVGPDVASLMNQELNGIVPAQTTEVPPTVPQPPQPQQFNQ